uniref:Uncharacterized protein n=1 Tax=Rhizophora mucronata TaxID=61149 RepID=A0A2P2LR58_RHIMU
MSFCTATSRGGGGRGGLGNSSGGSIWGN